MADTLNENDIEIPSILLPCVVCNRTFRPEALVKHHKVCEKNLVKKRKVFDSSKQRIQGTELAEFLPKLPVSTKKPEKSPIRKTQSKWKEKHAELVHTVRASRGDPGGDAPSLVKKSDHEKCPYCERFFGPKAFDRHLEWCKEQRVRIQPKSPASLQAKERLEARTKYRAPLLSKSRRTLTKEKYSPHSKVREPSPASLKSTSSPNTMTSPHTSQVKNTKENTNLCNGNFTRSSSVRGSKRVPSPSKKLATPPKSAEKSNVSSNKTTPSSDRNKETVPSLALNSNKEDLFSESCTITAIHPVENNNRLKVTSSRKNSTSSELLVPPVTRSYSDFPCGKNIKLNDLGINQLVPDITVVPCALYNHITGLKCSSLSDGPNCSNILNKTYTKSSAGQIDIPEDGLNNSYLSDLNNIELSFKNFHVSDNLFSSLNENKKDVHDSNHNILEVIESNFKEIDSELDSCLSKSTDESRNICSVNLDSNQLISNASFDSNSASLLDGHEDVKQQNSSNKCGFFTSSPVTEQNAAQKIYNFKDSFLEDESLVFFGSSDFSNDSESNLQTVRSSKHLLHSGLPPVKKMKYLNRIKYEYPGEQSDTNLFHKIPGPFVDGMCNTGLTGTKIGIAVEYDSKELHQKFKNIGDSETDDEIQYKGVEVLSNDLEMDAELSGKEDKVTPLKKNCELKDNIDALKTIRKEAVDESAKWSTLKPEKDFYSGNDLKTTFENMNLIEARNNNLNDSYLHKINKNISSRVNSNLDNVNTEENLSTLCRHTGEIEFINDLIQKGKKCNILEAIPRKYSKTYFQENNNNRKFEQESCRQEYEDNSGTNEDQYVYSCKESVYEESSSLQCWGHCTVNKCPTGGYAQTSYVEQYHSINNRIIETHSTFVHYGKNSKFFEKNRTVLPMIMQNCKEKVEEPITLKPKCISARSKSKIPLPCRKTDASRKPIQLPPITRNPMPSQKTNQNKITHLLPIPGTNPNNNRIKSASRSSDDNYDPFVSAERQLLELLGMSEEDQSKPNKSPLTKSPLVLSSPTSAFAKFSPILTHNSSSSSENGSQTIPPPSSFEDLEAQCASPPLTNITFRDKNKNPISLSSLSLCSTISIESVDLNRSGFKRSISNSAKGSEPRKEAAFQRSLSLVDSPRKGRDLSKGKLKMEDLLYGTSNVDNDRYFGSPIPKDHFEDSFKIDNNDNLPNISVHRTVSDEETFNAEQELLKSITEYENLFKCDSPVISTSLESLKLFPSLGCSKQQDSDDKDKHYNRDDVNKSGPDSAYNSLNRKSPLLESESADPGTRSSSESESCTPSLKTASAKFCHECGNRYPVNEAKFCCNCGVRRLFI